MKFDVCSPYLLMLFLLANIPVPSWVFNTKAIFGEKLKSLICFKFFTCEFKQTSNSLCACMKEMKIH